MRLFGLIPCCCGTGGSCPWDLGVITEAMERQLHGAHTITTTIGGTADNGAVNVEVADPTETFGIIVTASGLGAGVDPAVWTVVAIGDSSTPVAPTNPDDPQDVVITWNDVGDWSVTIGDAAPVTGNNPLAVDLTRFIIANPITASVGPTAGDCTQLGADDFWLTEDGAPWLLESGEPWEMEDA